MICGEVICLLGASGFIGGKLLSELTKLNCEIRIFTPKHISGIPTSIKQFHGSYKSTYDLTLFLQNCTLIYNCVGSYSNDDNINIVLPQLIIEVIRNFKNHYKVHFVQLSSVGVYGLGNSPKYIEVYEEFPCNPKNLYEISKFNADSMIINSSFDSYYTYTILRPTNVVGYGMKNNSFRQLINAISKFYYFKIGQKKSIINYIHVDDVIVSMLLVRNNEQAINEIFIVSNDFYLDDFVKRVRAIYGIKYPLIVIPKHVVIILSRLIRLFIINTPLTLNRINSLSNSTTYSSNKIYNLLKFKVNVNIDNMIVDMKN